MAAASALPVAVASRLQAALPAMKVVRVRVYSPPNPNPLFNQSDLVVTVETDAGITGIGEGGSPDTLKQSAGRLIGKDPQHIEQLWQDMSRSFFYPAGREKEDAIGALDLALWDIKGKVLNVPVHELLGGMVRNYCECYNTAGVIPGMHPGMSIRERAQLTIEAGYRAFRMGAADQPINTVYNTRERRESAIRRLRAGARRRREKRRLGGRLPPALRSFRCRSRLRSDRTARALLRRRSRCARKHSIKTSRSCAKRRRCRLRPAKNGATAGTSTAWLSITISIMFVPRCPTSEESPR